MWPSSYRKTTKERQRFSWEIELNWHLTSSRDSEIQREKRQMQKLSKAKQKKNFIWMRPAWANHWKLTIYFARRHVTKRGRLSSWLILFRCTYFTWATFVPSGVTEKGLYSVERAVSMWLFMPLFCTCCNYLVVFPREFLGVRHHVIHAPTTRRCILSADELCRTAGGSSCWTFIFSSSRAASGCSPFTKLLKGSCNN